MKRRNLLVLISIISSVGVIAQPKKRKNQIEYINSLQVTGGFGTATYFGDLCDNFDCAVFRPNSTFGLFYRNSNRLSLRAEFHYIRLYGTDVGGRNYVRNLHFRSNNYEVVFSGVYDLIPYERKFRYRSNITPYGHAGIGATYFSPQAKLNGKWYNLRPLATEGKSYSRFTPVVSYGVGARLKVSSQLNISGEIGYRWTFTDYLDDVSSTYVDNSSLKSPEAQALADRTNELDDFYRSYPDYDYANGTWNGGHQRGNPNKNDGYFLFEVKAEYRIMWTSQGGSILRKSKFR